MWGIDFNFAQGYFKRRFQFSVLERLREEIDLVFLKISA